MAARMTLKQLAGTIIADYRSDGRSVHNPKQVFRMLRDDLGLTMAAELEGKITERFKAACVGAGLSIYTANTRVATLNKIRRRSKELGFIREHEPLTATTASRFKPRAKRSAALRPTIMSSDCLRTCIATDFKGRRLYVLVSIVYSLALECAGLIRLGRRRTSTLTPVPSGSFVLGGDAGSGPLQGISKWITGSGC